MAGRLRPIQRTARTFGDHPWNSWPEEIAKREPAALAQLREDLKDQIAAGTLSAVRVLSSSGRRCARIVPSAAFASSVTSPFSSATTAPTSGRIPTFFACDEDLSPEVVAGVPPDAFSETGQRWGNPLIRLGRPEDARLRLVDRAHALGGGNLRHRSPRSLPRLRSLLGDSRRRTDRDQRTLGARSQ